MRYSVRRDSIPKPGVLWRDTLLLLERLRPTQGTPVLCYHKISHDPQAARHPLALPVSAFAQQMGLLASWGYEVVRLSDALSARPVSERRVAITFDDGHADALELAAPILKSYGFPATLFVVTDWVGRTGFLDHTTGARLDRPAAE